MSNKTNQIAAMAGVIAAVAAVAALFVGANNEIKIIVENPYDNTQSEDASRSNQLKVKDTEIPARITINKFKSTQKPKKNTISGSKPLKPIKELAGYVKSKCDGGIDIPIDCPL